MKTKIFLVVIFFGVFGAAESSRAATYYVDYDSGNDANSGTSTSSAWKHAPGDSNASGNASRTLSAGDTVLFKGGVYYRGSFTIASSGTNGNPVTYKGDSWPGLENQKAIIDGGEPLNNWQKCSSQSACLDNANWDRMYYKDISLPSFLTISPALSLLINQNDRPLAVAQYPKSGQLMYQTTDNYYSVSQDKVTSTSLNDPRLADLGGNDLVGKYIYIWVVPNEVSQSKITSFNSSTNTITWADSLNVYPDRNSVYAVANIPNSEIFKEPGTYYFDEANNRIYVIPYDGVDLTTGGDMTVSKQAMGIHIYGDYINVEGFIIQKQSGDSYCEGTAIKAVIGTGGLTGNNIKNIEARMSKGDACYTIQLYSSNSSLTDSYIHDTGGSLVGTIFGGSGITIKNNKYERISRTVIWSAGGKDSYIVGNNIIDSHGVHGNSLTVYQGSSNVLVADNKVINSNISTFEESANITWYNNILSNGLACWGNCEYCLVANNNFGFSGLGLYSTTNKTVKNNIGWKLGNTDNNIDTFQNDSSAILANAPRLSESILDINKMTSAQNQNTVYIDNGYQNVIKPNDILIFNFDGMQRTVTAVEALIFGGNWRTKITFSPAVSTLLDGYAVVWPSGTTNFNIDYRLKLDSPAVNAAANILSLLPISTLSAYNYNKDIEGNPRSSDGNSWDIGAYEYQSSIDTTAPNVPSGLSVQ